MPRSRATALTARVIGSVLLFGLFAVSGQSALADPLLAWIDADPGHRFVRLSTGADTVGRYFPREAFARPEPNVHFTPAMKWLILRSNLHGAFRIHAAEIVKPNSP